MVDSMEWKKVKSKGKHIFKGRKTVSSLPRKKTVKCINHFKSLMRTIIVEETR